MSDSSSDITMSDSSSNITYGEKISFPPTLYITISFKKILTVSVSLSTSFSIPINLQIIHEEKVMDLFVLLLYVYYFSKGKTSGH